MRKAEVFYNGEPAGTLTQFSTKSYEFRYNDEWLANSSKPAVSLTLPKNRQAYHAEYLFPFFFNLLSEGANKELQCQQLKIDENDHFGLLLAVAHTDTIGAVTVKAVNQI